MKLTRELFLKMLLGLTVTVGFAFAAELLSLKGNMVAANKLLKQIKATAADTTQNQANIKNTQAMIDSFVAARDQFPGVGDKAEFVALMDQEIVLFKELQTALQNNENSKVLNIIQQIKIIEKEGHNKFN